MILEWIKEHLVEMIIVSAILLIIIGVAGGAIDNEKMWNDGRCECGGKWEFVESVTRYHKTDDSIYTTTSYIYKCNDCGKMHEFSVLR